jgi:integrase
MALRKIHNVYYIYFRDVDGTQRTRSLKTTDKEIAKRLHDGYMKQLQSKKGEMVIMRDFPEHFRDVKPITTIAPPVTTDNGRLKMENFIRELEKIQPVSGTNKRAIKRFMAAVNVKYADQVTPAMALKYLEKNYTSGRNYKAFNNNKGILNKAFKHLLVKIGLPQSPFDRIPSRTVKNVKNHRPISTEEFLRIFANSEEPYRTAACLGFYAGADMSTAFGLPGTAVYMEERIIYWKRPKTGTKFICGIHDELYCMLKRLNIDRESSAPILPKICSTYRNEYFRELFEKLGICDTEEGKASFHSFRTSFFTRCDEANLHRRTTSLAGGHVDDRQNDWYSHDISAAHEVEKLPSVGIPMGD